MTKEVEAHWQSIRDVMIPVNHKLFELLGDRVVTGPFSGMKVIPDPVWNDGNAGAKLIGSYEFELHGAIRRAIGRKPTVVVNVGCAEGYYAVGLGRHLPSADIYAMDIDNGSLDQCEKIANENKVAVRTVVGRAVARDLMRAEGRCLYVIDCEGDEIHVLDKVACPILAHSDIIVECHDFFYPDHSASIFLFQRFADTHEVEWIHPQIPNPADYSFLKSLPLGFQLLAITEKRPPGTVWLACWANRR